ncbi:MAG: glycosyltransferase [Polyangiaceae bacterium]
MKPLAGEDDDLAANLASFASLSCIDGEILFGWRRSPTRPRASLFLAAHPEVDARLVVTDRRAAENPKVAQLVGLAAAARGDVLVISDSNVRVAPAYLESLLVALASRTSVAPVGLATSLFVGTGERTLGAALENQ